MRMGLLFHDDGRICDASPIKAQERVSRDMSISIPSTAEGDVSSSREGLIK
jgi:hypothetical protein